MSTAPESEHLPDRPHWRCRACARPWPCSDARASLLHEYRAYPSLLKIYLSAQMYEALDDFTAHGDAPPLDLYDRFLIWARAHPTAASRPPDADDPSTSLPVPPRTATPPPAAPPAATPQIRPPLVAALLPTPLPH